MKAAGAAVFANPSYPTNGVVITFKGTRYFYGDARLMAVRAYKIKWKDSCFPLYKQLNLVSSDQSIVLKLYRENIFQIQ